MDTTAFDSLTRTVTDAIVRRTALRGFLGAAVAAVAGGSLLQADADARKKKRKKRRRKKSKKQTQQGTTSPTTSTPPPPPPPDNVCEGKNWCLDRTQTCGPAGGYAKCLVEASGDNLCAEILYQAKTCAECAAPTCTNCRCALAAGGGDRCNNGATGHDFICVRPI